MDNLEWKWMKWIEKTGEGCSPSPKTILTCYMLHYLHPFSIKSG